MLQIGDRFGQGLACKVVGEGLGTLGSITKAPLGLWLRQAAALPGYGRTFCFYGPRGIRTLDLSDANRTLSHADLKEAPKGQNISFEKWQKT